MEQGIKALFILNIQSSCYNPIYRNRGFLLSIQPHLSENHLVRFSDIVFQGEELLQRERFPYSRY
jgi:hypothetical protein